MARALHIGIVGDFERTRFSHWALEASLYHAATQQGRAIELHWLGTEQITNCGAERCLGEMDGLWGAPGGPFASNDGMLAAIGFARQSGLPFLGTCAGFQYALIEFTRNVLGLPDADSAENGPSQHIVITPVSCPLPGRRADGPPLSGSDDVYPVAGTLLAWLCGEAPLRGEYNCSFETNAEYVPRWQEAGLCIAARDARGELRAFTLPTLRFFWRRYFSRNCRHVRRRRTPSCSAS